MNKLIFMIWCLMLISGTSFAQKYSNSLSGKLTNGDTSKTYIGYKLVFELYENDQIIQNWVPLQTVTALVNENGEFTCSFNAPGPYFYLKMEILNGGELILDFHNSLTHKWFFCQKGDNLNLEVMMDFKEAVFTGKGSEKMNCQYLINNTKIDRPSSAVIQNYSLIHEPRSDASHRIHVALLKMKESILGSYKAILSDSVYNRIKKDMLYDVKFEFLRRAVPPNARLITSKIIDDGIRILENGANNPESLAYVDSTESESPYRVQFILNYGFILYQEALRTKKTDLNYSAWLVNFAQGFKINPTLHDDILIALICDRLRFYPDEFSNLFPEILSFTNDLKKKRLIQYLIATLSPKGKVIPFEFVTEDDKRLTSKDLKNNIVLMDFWFTGCTPCKSITPIMKRIMERLKHRSDVVYLSISVDAKKELWQESVKNGQYTVPGQMHVFTGSGRNVHPFLVRYGIRSYPQITLLGKEGKIIAFNLEPRRDNGDEIVRLIENLN